MSNSLDSKKNSKTFTTNQISNTLDTNEKFDISNAIYNVNNFTMIDPYNYPINREVYNTTVNKVVQNFFQFLKEQKYIEENIKFSNKSFVYEHLIVFFTDIIVTIDKIHLANKNHDDYKYDDICGKPDFERIFVDKKKFIDKYVVCNLNIEDPISFVNFEVYLYYLSLIYTYKCWGSKIEDNNVIQKPDNSLKRKMQDFESGNLIKNQLTLLEKVIYENGDINFKVHFNINYDIFFNKCLIDFIFKFLNDVQLNYKTK